MYAPLGHILGDLITTYREKESAIICFYGSIAFLQFSMIQLHSKKFAVFAGKLPAILKLPFELPAKSFPAKSPCLEKPREGLHNARNS